MHLVLLPGMDGTGDLFAPLISALPDDTEYSIVSYSRTACSSWEELMEVVIQASPPEKPITLVAESFSGPLAIMLASQRRLDIRGLVLCCSFASNPLPSWFRWLPVPGFLLASMPGYFVRRFLVERSSPPELVSAIQDCVKSVSPRVLANRAKMILTVNVQEPLRKLKLPVMYLAGSQDRAISNRGWKQIQSQLPESTLVELQGPHLLLQCSPASAVAEIMKFCKEEADHD
jgi:pimeloyl-[acyl-carrier protein] methyl ester esterase